MFASKIESGKGSKGIIIPSFQLNELPLHPTTGTGYSIGSLPDEVSPSPKASSLPQQSYGNHPNHKCMQVI